MFYKLFLKKWPLEKQVRFFKSKAVLIGSRDRGSRKVFIYMHGELFAEICFVDDNPENLPESVNIVKGLSSLNNQLEEEFRSKF